MVEITNFVEYRLHRLKSALYEEWTEGKVVHRRCVRQGSVSFCDLRAILTDLIDLCLSIHPTFTVLGNLKRKKHLRELVIFVFPSVVSFGFFSVFITGGCRYVCVLL